MLSENAMVTRIVTSIRILPPPYTPQSHSAPAASSSFSFLYLPAGRYFAHSFHRRAGRLLDLYRKKCSLIVRLDSTSQMAVVQTELSTSIQTSRIGPALLTYNATRQRGGGYKAFNALSPPLHFPHPHPNRKHLCASSTYG